MKKSPLPYVKISNASKSYEFIKDPGNSPLHIILLCNALNFLPLILQCFIIHKELKYCFDLKPADRYKKAKKKSHEVFPGDHNVRNIIRASQIGSLTTFDRKSFSTYCKKTFL